MALAKSALAAALQTALKDPGVPGETATAYTTRVANNLADAIDAYVKTGTVTVPMGVAVTVVPATGIGATTGPGTGTIS